MHCTSFLTKDENATDHDKRHRKDAHSLTECSRLDPPFGAQLCAAAAAWASISRFRTSAWLAFFNVSLWLSRFCAANCAPSLPVALGALRAFNAVSMSILWP